MREKRTPQRSPNTTRKRTSRHSHFPCTLVPQYYSSPLKLNVRIWNKNGWSLQGMNGKRASLRREATPLYKKERKAAATVAPQTVAPVGAPRRTADRPIRIVSPGPPRAFPTRFIHPRPTQLSSSAAQGPTGTPKGIPAHGQNAHQILVSSHASGFRRSQPLSLPAPRPTAALSSESLTGGWREEVLSYHLRARVKIHT